MCEAKSMVGFCLCVVARAVSRAIGGLPRVPARLPEGQLGLCRQQHKNQGATMWETEPGPETPPVPHHLHWWSCIFLSWI